MNKSLFATMGDGCRIFYRFDGSTNKPVLLLSNSIGTTSSMWNLQIDELTRHYRVLRYDSRGHGLSDVPVGPYSLDRLGRDVIELLDNLGLDHVDFCGLSLGGMVGQWLGIHAPERINRLILCNSSSYLGPADQWTERITSVLRDDISVTAEMFLRNWFPTKMLDENGPLVQHVRTGLLAMNPQGFAGSYAAVRDMDMRRTGALINRPTLVIAGQFDTVTLASHSELIAGTVPGAKLVVLPVVHLSNIELPDAFMKAVLDFLLEGRSLE